MMLCERVNYDVFCVQSINQLHCLQGTLFTGEQEAFSFKIRWYAILRLERNTVKAFLSCQASPDFVGVFYIQSHPCLGLWLQALVMHVVRLEAIFDNESLLLLKTADTENVLNHFFCFISISSRNSMDGTVSTLWVCVCHVYLMARKASKPLATGSPTSHSCNTFCLFFFLYQNITDAGLDKTILNNFYCAKTAAQVCC